MLRYFSWIGLVWYQASDICARRTLLVELKYVWATLGWGNFLWRLDLTWFILWYSIQYHTVGKYSNSPIHTFWSQIRLQALWSFLYYFSSNFLCSVVNCITMNHFASSMYFVHCAVSNLSSWLPNAKCIINVILT